MASKPWCLDVEGVYSLGDLNMMFRNKQTLDYPPIDPRDPSKPFFTGVIRQSVTVGEDERRFLAYIPARFPISGAGLYLCPDDGVSCEACLEDGWRELADETNVALIILEAREGGWSQEDIQSEVSYCEEVFKSSISRVYFSLNEATYYICGLGTGAYVAAAHGLLSSTLFSCILADGDYHLDSRLLDQLGTILSDRDPLASKLDVAMPAWLVDRGGKGEGDVLKCLLRANMTDPEPLAASIADIYRQDLRKTQGSLDGLPMTEVCFTPAKTAANISPAELHRSMLHFALRFKRWLSVGNGCFRPARTAEDMRLTRYEMEDAGLTREYFVYEPSIHRRCPEKKLPLLLAIHGYACTGTLFAENCEWHTIGERRDLWVVYVSAWPSNLSFGGRTVPLPTWNAVGMPSGTDDVSFIARVLDEVKERYPVDEERIYVSGHSNGSLMTQTLMARMPLTFAAFAPQGAQFHMSLDASEEAAKRDIPDDGILRPVWLMMGSDDIGDKDRIEPGNANDRFIDMMCRLNGLDRGKESFLVNGKYHTHTWCDEAGRPLLRFTGIQDTPHTFTPEMAQIYWDQFLCHFRRLSDGSVVYTV